MSFTLGSVKIALPDPAVGAAKQTASRPAAGFASLLAQITPERQVARGGSVVADPKTAGPADSPAKAVAGLPVSANTDDAMPVVTSPKPGGDAHVEVPKAHVAMADFTLPRLSLPQPEASPLPWHRQTLAAMLPTSVKAAATQRKAAGIPGPTLLPAATLMVTASPVADAPSAAARGSGKPDPATLHTSPAGARVAQPANARMQIPAQTVQTAQTRLHAPLPAPAALMADRSSLGVSPPAASPQAASPPIAEAPVASRQAASVPNPLLRASPPRDDVALPAAAPRVVQIGAPTVAIPLPERGVAAPPAVLPAGYRPPAAMQSAPAATPAAARLPIERAPVEQTARPEAAAVKAAPVAAGTVGIAPEGVTTPVSVIPNIAAAPGLPRQAPLLDAVPSVPAAASTVASPGVTPEAATIPAGIRPVAEDDTAPATAQMTQALPGQARVAGPSAPSLRSLPPVPVTLPVAGALAASPAAAPRQAVAAPAKAVATSTEAPSTTASAASAPRPAMAAAHDAPVAAASRTSSPTVAPAPVQPPQMPDAVMAEAAADAAPVIAPAPQSEAPATPAAYPVKPASQASAPPQASATPVAQASAPATAFAAPQSRAPATGYRDDSKAGPPDPLVLGGTQAEAGPAGTNAPATAPQAAQPDQAAAQTNPGAPPLSPPPVPPAAQLAQAVASLHVSPDGTSHVTIRLDPAELGQVQIRVSRAADGTSSVNVTVERAETLATMQGDLGHLHQALDRAGVPEQRSVMMHLASASDQGGSMSLGARTSQDGAQQGASQQGGYQHSGQHQGGRQEQRAQAGFAQAPAPQTFGRATPARPAATAASGVNITA